jgi:putative SOS response-associated peptidase YedK
MCGKFTQMMSWGELHEFADFLTAPAGETETVMPMRDASIIRLGKNGVRETVRMRWGFAKANATAPSKRPDHIHARSESLDDRVTFRDAFKDRRGILVVKTFNEGEEVTPKKTRQHTITPRDGKPMAIAVLWEDWEHEEGPTLSTFVMVTVAANTLISSITDRMPAMLQPEDWAKWLGEEPASPDELKAMLKVFEGDWDMAPEIRQPPPPKPKAPNPQGSLF